MAEYSKSAAFYTYSITKMEKAFRALVIFLKTNSSYRRHEVEFHGHGDDIEAYDGGNGKVEILAGTDLMKPGSPRRVVQPVWNFWLVCGRGRKMRNQNSSRKALWFRTA